MTDGTFLSNGRHTTIKMFFFIDKEVFFQSYFLDTLLLNSRQMNNEELKKTKEKMQMYSR